MLTAKNKVRQQEFRQEQQHDVPGHDTAKIEDPKPNMIRNPFEDYPENDKDIRRTPSSD